MAKSEIIKFRCSTEQRKAIEAAARAADSTISEWMLAKCFVATATPIVATKSPKPKKVVATTQKTARPFVCLLKGI